MFGKRGHYCFGGPKIRSTSGLDAHECSKMLMLVRQPLDPNIFGLVFRGIAIGGVDVAVCGNFDTSKASFIYSSSTSTIKNDATLHILDLKSPTVPCPQLPRRPKRLHGNRPQTPRAV